MTTTRSIDPVQRERGERLMDDWATEDAELEEQTVIDLRKRLDRPTHLAAAARR